MPLACMAIAVVVLTHFEVQSTLVDLMVALAFAALGSLGMGAVLTWFGRFDAIPGGGADGNTQPGAPPNGGPVQPRGNAGISGGPPSAS